MTFVRELHECRRNFHMSRTNREGFENVQKFHANFFAKMCHKTVVRKSYDLRASVANLSPRNFGNLQYQNFATIV